MHSPPAPLRALRTEPGDLSLVLSCLSHMGDSMVSQAAHCPNGKDTSNKLP